MTHVVLVVSRIDRTGPVSGAVALAKQLPGLDARVTVASLAPSATWDSAVRQELEQAGVEVASPNLPGWPSVLRSGRFGAFLQGSQADVVCGYGIRPDILASAEGGPWATFGSVRGMLREHYRVEFGRRWGTIAVGLHLRALRRMDGVIAISKP